MNIKPHERWKMRSENGPWARVTWLWYNSIGLMARDPNSSSCAYGPKTDVRSTRAPRPEGWVGLTDCNGKKGLSDFFF